MGRVSLGRIESAMHMASWMLSVSVALVKSGAGRQRPTRPSALSLWWTVSEVTMLIQQRK